MGSWMVTHVWPALSVASIPPRLIELYPDYRWRRLRREERRYIGRPVSDSNPRWAFALFDDHEFAVAYIDYSFLARDTEAIHVLADVWRNLRRELSARTAPYPVNPIVTRQQQDLAGEGLAVGQCPECRSYTATGAPPILHHPGCRLDPAREEKRGGQNVRRNAMTGCVFCAIVAGQAPATVVAEWPDALAIVPHRPVVPGHVLVIPRTHVRDFADDPEVTAATMRRAAELARGPANLITSAGEEATQTVFHLHVHIVPRADGDGLPLPWTPQQEAQRSAANAA